MRLSKEAIRVWHMLEWSCEPPFERPDLRHLATLECRGLITANRRVDDPFTFYIPTAKGMHFLSNPQKKNKLFLLHSKLPLRFKKLRKDKSPRRSAQRPPKQNRETNTQP